MYQSSTLSKVSILGGMNRRGNIANMHTFKRFIFLTIVALLVLAGPFLFGYHFNTLKKVSKSLLEDPKHSFNHITNQSPSTRGFHLLLPATDPNVNLCKLLLTAGLLGYPEPIFLGWHGRGMYNGTASHLFKITETLAYLHSLPASQDDDMVLVLDAYDIWLQLRPDVLISRYYSVVAKNDARLRNDGILGEKWGGEVVRSRLVFGPDKIHWPQHSPDPAVWAVPDSTMALSAFGPDTGGDMFTTRPKWLNSGTIMGPVKDMRDMFAATVDMLSKMYDSGFEFRTSDQYYFAEVWGEQEVNRMRLRDGDAFTVPEGAHLPHTGWSNPGSEVRTEYGITLDYETEIFQTAAAYDRHLLWMRHNGTRTAPFEQDSTEEQSSYDRGMTIDQWTLAEDVESSESPFSAADELSRQDGWADMMLGTNAITQATFPLFHVTGDKSLRERWWPRMWFHPHAEVLLKAAKRKQAAQQDPSIFLSQKDVLWRSARTDGLHHTAPFSKNEKGGAWTDGGDYVEWDVMCGAFEDKLFLR